MRLTLRTLLAYLDDTLEPVEIKKIGQKVTESETAQELISRIKQVTRRRRITTPPLTGPNSFEPNMVADYLDNELSPEQVAELEKICLESDVHLAEVASCHQILTLVLGEPASVPPMAKERMYALVRGREAIPFRKAATTGAAGAAGAAGDHDADEMFLLGLPFYRRNSWLRWALPVAGVLLLVVIGVALWQTVLGVQQPNTNTQVASSNSQGKNGEANTAEKKNEANSAKQDNKQEAVKPISTNQGKNPSDTANDPSAAGKNNGTPSETPNEGKQPEKKADSDPAERKKEPSTERAAVGSYHFGARSPVSILMLRPNTAKDGWQRLKAGDRISTTDRLVSLPGYASEVHLDSGVRLVLRGHVREFSLVPDMDHLQQSAVILHKNKEVDADLTLLTGRLYFSNHKTEGNALVRLRFEKEVWDLSLEPGAEMAADLLRRFRGDVDYMKGEGPIVSLHVLLMKGKASAAIDRDHFQNLSMPGPAYFLWDTKGGQQFRAGLNGPIKVEKAPEFFNNPLPVDPKNQDAEKMDLALDTLSKQMLPPKDPSVVLREILQKSTDPAARRLAIYCLGAMDEADDLLEVLGDSDPKHMPDRETAIFTLRRWLERDPSHGPKLYDSDKEKAGPLLSQQNYQAGEAKRLFILLHPFSEEEIFNTETYELLASDLASEKVAIAELAHWHLYRLVRIQGVNLPVLDKFNAAFPRDVRQNVFREVRDKIDRGELPARGSPQDKNAPPGGGKEPQPGRAGQGRPESKR